MLVSIFQKFLSQKILTTQRVLCPTLIQLKTSKSEGEPPSSILIVRSAGAGDNLEVHELCYKLRYKRSPIIHGIGI